MNNIMAIDRDYLQQFGIDKLRQFMARDGVGAETRINTRTALDDRVRIIPVNGLINKSFTNGFATSTVDLRREIRNAKDDSKVEAIIIPMDTPGGFTSGVDEAATEIARAATVKPVIVQAEDLLASAGVWIASQATTINATRTTTIGSIGTISVLYDDSKMLEDAGIKTNIITTADLKGTGVSGVEITDEMIANIREQVESIDGIFKGAIRSGRPNMGEANIESVSDGRMLSADQARNIGLIDNVQSFEDTLNDIMGGIVDRERQQRAASVVARSRLRQIK